MDAMGVAVLNILLAGKAHTGVEIYITCDECDFYECLGIKTDWPTVSRICWNHMLDHAMEKHNAS